MRTPALSRYTVSARSSTSPGLSFGALATSCSSTDSTFDASISPRTAQIGTDRSTRTVTSASPAAPLMLPTSS